jgi:hypothetical protein
MYGVRQLLISCGGGRRPVDGLCQQHVHTIRPLVWDTLENFPPLGLPTWDEDSTLHARGRRTNQYRMTDKHLNYGTSLNSRDDDNINVGLYGESRGGDTDKRTTWRPRKFTSVEKMSCPCQLKMYRDKMEEGHEWSFKDHGNSMQAPIARGANLQSVCNAMC